MDLEKYAFKIISSEPARYEFLSEGRRGQIKKIVRFSVIDVNVPVYNLGFGDYDRNKNLVDDQAISNNNDHEKILNTLAAIVLDFSRRYPKACIMGSGSTVSRTRLYRMAITKGYKEINILFNIYGYNGVWEAFLRGKDYDAFLIAPKTY